MRKSLYTLIMLLVVFVFYGCVNTEKIVQQSTVKEQPKVQQQQPLDPELQALYDKIANKSQEEQAGELEKYLSKIREKKDELMKQPLEQFKKLQDQWEQSQDKMVARIKEIIDQLNLKNSELYKLVEDRQARFNKLEKSGSRHRGMADKASVFGRILYELMSIEHDTQIREWDEKIRELSKQKDTKEEAQISAAKSKDKKLNSLKQEAKKIEEQIEALFKKIDDDITIGSINRQIKELMQKGV